MWSWLFGLRNCFGADQKRDRSPSPPPRLQQEGPLASSRRHEEFQQTPGESRLHWGQNTHPKTPGSQREQVLRPGVSAGLRNRYAASQSFSTFDGIEQDLDSPAFHSAQALHSAQQSAVELAEFHNSSEPNRASRPPAVQPVNLQSRLAAEADQKNARQGSSTTPGRQRIGQGRPTAKQLSRRSPADLPWNAGPRRPSPLIRTPRERPSGYKREAPSALSRQPGRPQPGSPSSSNLKRKSSSISRSPNKSPAPSDDVGSASGRARQVVPPLALNQLGGPAQQDVLRLKLDVEEPAGSLPAVHGVLEDVEKVNYLSASAGKPSWAMPSPRKSSSRSPRRPGKENDIMQSVQLTTQSLHLDPLRDSVAHPHSPSRLKQLLSLDSPASNPGSSPRHHRFLFSHDDAYGTPVIVGVRNEDEEFREDKRLRVYKTPFDIRVDREIEKEQAYKEQLALKRRKNRNTDAAV